MDSNSTGSPVPVAPDLELPITSVVRDLIRQPPVVIYDDDTARAAADHMVLEDVGRVVVIARDAPRRVIGMVSRSDLVGAHASRLAAHEVARPHLSARLAEIGSRTRDR